MTKETATAYRRDAAEVVASLGSDVRRGLTADDARARLSTIGPNTLATEPPVSAWRRLLAQFTNVLVLLLLVATAVSLVVWFYERDAALPYEAMAIFAIVLLNAVMGFVQEARAEAAITALRSLSADVASVIRDGERQRVAAADLVPGDIVLIEEGDTIPADARLLESISLQTSEAALTGESLPVSKNVNGLAEAATLGDRSNMLFSGTVATFGRGVAIVTATGMRTEIGHIAGLLHAVPRESTPLQHELDRTGRMLGTIVVAIAFVMIVTIVFVEDIRGVEGLLGVFILGVALAVAAVPEGLPAIVTAVLSLGVERMARRNAIVRHLAAVETLGSASVIASDKTGTLTKNEMTVRVVVTASGRATFTGSGYAPQGEVRCDDDRTGGTLRLELEHALAAADRASNAVVREESDGRWIVHGDPTEAALITAARKAGLARDTLDRRLPRLGELPFSSERKLMTTLHRDNDRARMVSFTKGAPDVLLARCAHELVGDEARALTPERRREIEDAVDALASEALRTLAVGIHRFADAVTVNESGGVDESLEQNLIFAGVVGMIDPPRDEAIEAVRRARVAGIRPIMITGDHPRTAAVIARELGIAEDERVATGAQLARASDAELAELVRDVSVYARVDPEHKLRIVKALQHDGAIVAMTGDGVNDAPALQTADIGVAMGINGTDVSKGAADIVLADDNFATIVAAVEEGRGIFANIRKFLWYLLSSNIGEVLTMFFGVIFARSLGLPVAPGSIVLPLLATQILWVNLVTDGAPALALGIDPVDASLMNQPPRPRTERVVTPAMWRSIVTIGVVMATSTLLVLDASLPGGLVNGTGELRYGQTMAFTTLVFAQLFNVFNARAGDRSAFLRLFANRWLWAAIALSLGLQGVVLYVAVLQRAFGTVGLSVVDLSRCLIAASVTLWAGEALRMGRRLLARRSEAS